MSSVAGLVILDQIPPMVVIARIQILMAAQAVVAYSPLQRVVVVANQITATSLALCHGHSIISKAPTINKLPNP